MLTEAQAWRKMGDAYSSPLAEVRAQASIGRAVGDDTGICIGILRLASWPTDEGDISFSTKLDMEERLFNSGEPGFITGYTYFDPQPDQPEGREIRAMLAYLFAEEAADAASN